MDRCTQFRVIVVTDPQIHPQTDRTDYNTLRRSLARSVKMRPIYFVENLFLNISLNFIKFHVTALSHHLQASRRKGIHIVATTDAIFATINAVIRYKWYMSFSYILVFHNFHAPENCAMWTMTSSFKVFKRCPLNGAKNTQN